MNGAQTVGTIGTSIDPVDLSDPRKIEDASPQAWVQVRIIKCPPGFDRQITRTTNFQNSVQERDFAAMDTTQHRLATEFALDQRQYVVKSGEPDPHGTDGCGIVEATQALACANADAELAVQVKREISVIWRNTDAKPYTDLFNDSVTGLAVWRCVQIMRLVENELHELRKRIDIPRADLTGTHMNRTILHLVFQDPEVRHRNHDDIKNAEILDVAKEAVHRIFPRVAEYLEAHHPTEYLGTLSKNTQKCVELAKAFAAKDPEKPKVEFKLTPS